MIPDFGKIDRGKLEVKGDAPLYGTALAQQALQKVGVRIAEIVAEKANFATATVLVTSDAQFADSDVAYQDVMTGLSQLIKAGKQQVEDPEVSEATAPQPHAATAIIGAIAAALPGAISLLSAHRTVTTSAIAASDLAAAAAVAGALLDDENFRGRVVHDSMRLLPDGIVARRVRELDNVRLKLVEKKQELETEQSQQPTQEKTLRDNLTALQRELEADDADVADLQRQMSDAEQQLAVLAGRALAITARLAGINTVVAAIDPFMAALRTVPEGGTRSPLAAAMLREGVHEPRHDAAQSTSTSGADAEITHVLLVKSEAGSAQQAIDDKPFWFDEKFSVVAAASVTYMLLEPPDDGLVGAGTVVDVAQGHGRIGSTFELEESG